MSTREEALYELAMIEPPLDAVKIEGVVAQYPEHAAALVAASVGMSLDDLGEAAAGEEEPATEAEVELGMAAFREHRGSIQRSRVRSRKG